MNKGLNVKKLYKNNVSESSHIIRHWNEMYHRAKQNCAILLLRYIKIAALVMYMKVQ